MKRLLIRPGAIGDFILSLPAMECLRSDFTEVWAASQNLPLAQFADHTRSIASTGLDLAGLPEVEAPPRLWAELQRFDSIVSWYGSNRPEFRRAVAGLPFQFLQAVPDEGCRMHAADFYMRQAAGLVGRVKEAIPALACPRVEGEYATIHPFSGSKKKNWPLERFLELSKLLERKMPVRWVVERGSWSGDGVDLAPIFEDLYEMACWLAGALVYVGNDSGITHLAAAAGTRTVALFGPTDPRVWSPRGEKVTVIATPQPGDPMELIELEEVVRTLPAD